MGGDVRMRRFSAVLGIIGALDVPIVYFSVKWWRTQHPTTFIMERGGLQHDMAVTLQVGMLAILCLFIALVLKRMGLEKLQEARDALRAEVETAETGNLGPRTGPGGAR